jgi:hypothetical protein
VAGAAALLRSRGLNNADSVSALVKNGDYDWTDDSGDGKQEPLLDVSNTVFDPTLVATGEESDPPPPTTGTTMHVSDLDGTSMIQNKNRWQASVAITVEDDSANRVGGATVSGTWETTGRNVQCTTDSSGSCTFSSGSVSNSIPELTFRVSDVAHSSFTYDAGANTDSDGDSTGTIITVDKP